MIPPANPLTEVTTLEGEEAEATIGDQKWVMRALADLYSDREMAVVREYSTNAYDAHVMAGIDDPIEVTLPSLLNPEFRVKDHGVGMSKETLLKVYLSFGVSDKRNSNDVNGMLGFGCKAAVAYTNTFTVTSVMDGYKTVALVSRRADWSIGIKVIAYAKTTERNGTEIVVPVHNPDEFAHKARDFYKYWLPGRVLVNGSEPSHAVGEKISDGFYYAEGYESRIVMGNVPYPITNPAALFYGLRINQVAFVAYVDGGAVEFSNSREALKYTDLTKATLRKAIESFEHDIIAQAKTDIDKATSHADAYAKWTKWTSRLGRNLFTDLTYNGDKFVNQFPINAFRVRIHSSRRMGNYMVNSWEVGDMDNAIIVTGMPSAGATAQQKSLMRDWLAHTSRSVTYVLFTVQSSVVSPWVDQSRVFDWETIKSETPKKPKAPRGISGRVPGSWDYDTINGRVHGKPLPSTGQVYYVELQAQKHKDIVAKMRLLNMKADASVIIVPVNRLEKFKRENPKVKEFLAYLTTRVVKDSPTLLSDDAKAALDYTADERAWLNKLDANKIDDPDWKHEVEVIKNQTTLTQKYMTNLALARDLGVWYSVKQYESKGLSPMLSRYPLLSTIRDYYGNRLEKDEIYIYMNAKYASLEGN